MMRLPVNIPYQKEILEHQKKFPEHKSFKIIGTNKREKLRMPFCVSCNKAVGVISIRTSKNRRKVVR